MQLLIYTFLSVFFIFSPLGLAFNVQFYCPNPHDIPCDLLPLLQLQTRGELVLQSNKTFIFNNPNNNHWAKNTYHSPRPMFFSAQMNQSNQKNLLNLFCCYACPYSQVCFSWDMSDTPGKLNDCVFFNNSTHMCDGRSSELCPVLCKKEVKKIVEPQDLAAQKKSLFRSNSSSITISYVIESKFELELPTRIKNKIILFLSSYVKQSSVFEVVIFTNLSSDFLKYSICITSKDKPNNIINVNKKVLLTNLLTNPNYNTPKDYNADDTHELSFISDIEIFIINKLLVRYYSRIKGNEILDNSKTVNNQTPSLRFSPL